MFRNVEVRHLHAVIVLAEERNFTRAADKLHITQPALSKQIPTSKKSIDFIFSLAIRDGLWNSRMRGVSSSKKLAWRSCIRSGLCILLRPHRKGPTAF